LKIAFLEPHLGVVGGIRRIIETANGLLNRGHKVSIFVPHIKPITWLPNRVPILKIKNLQNYDFDIVIFNLSDQYKVALSSNSRKKIFWCLAPEASYKHPDVPIKALKAPFYFLANSKYTVAYMRQYGNVSQKEIPILPGGINPDHFKYDPTIPKTHHVLWFGSPRPWKGGALIERVINRMPKIKALKMMSQNTPQHRMYALYGGCNMYVSANLSEGFSFGQLEAMACGCVVLTSDDGGSRDYIFPNVNALVVPRNEVGIEKGIRTLINDKLLMRKLRKNGLKTAAEPRFNWENITEKLERILLNL